jgi:putative transposase
MPRHARIALPNLPQHLIQRGNNRDICFFTDEDYQKYLEWLGEAAEKNDCRIHAYVLMSNHVHLLLSAERAAAPGSMMKSLGQRYVQYINRTYRRSGTLWEGRYRSCPVQEETYFMACQRYIELNPVRAGMVAQPGQYAWSSYRANADGQENPLVTPHRLYLAIAKDAETRCLSYRDFFKQALESSTLEKIRHATNGNFALGNQQFSDSIAKSLGRRASPGRPGRPPKQV